VSAFLALCAKRTRGTGHPVAGNVLANNSSRGLVPCLCHSNFAGNATKSALDGNIPVGVVTGCAVAIVAFSSLAL